jgi:Protein of unknown function (DUF2442)
MNTSTNKFDAIEKMIFDEGIRIETIDIHPELDVMLILLNTKAVIKQKLSSYPALQKADKATLQNFEIIGGGTGVHWPSLDEDLSLKGFLTEELLQFVKNEVAA